MQNNIYSSFPIFNTAGEKFSSPAWTIPCHPSADISRHTAFPASGRDIWFCVAGENNAGLGNVEYGRKSNTIHWVEFKLQCDWKAAVSNEK